MANEIEIRITANGTRAKAAIAAVAAEAKGLGKVGDKAGSALMGIGKGLLAVSAAGSAVSVIGGVAAAATQASGALLLLPGALAAVKIGLGAIDMGAGDFLSAMGNLNDNKAFKKNMEAMGESAGAVAAQIKIAHDSLADGLGEKMFAGVEAKIKPLIASTLPQLKASYDSIAVSVNRTGLALLDFLNQSNRQADLNKLIQDSGGIWKQLLQSVVPLGAAFLDIAVVGSDALRKMTAGLGGAAQKFADFIARARESGQIKKWIDSGVQAFKDMWHIVENVGSTIGSVFRGLGVSMGSPLSMLRDLTDRMAEFMKSASAQEGLHTLGEALTTIGKVAGWVVQTALSQLAETLVAVAPVAATVAQTLGVLLVGALNTLGPILRVIAAVLTEFPGVTVAATVAVVGFVAAMKAIKAVNAVTDLLGIESAFSRIGKSAGAAEAAGKGAGIAWGRGLVGGLGLAGAGIGATIILDKILPRDAAVTHGTQIARDMLSEMATVFQGGGTAFQTLNVAQWISNPISMAVEVGKRKLMELFGVANSKIPPITFDANLGPAQGQVAGFMNQVKGTSGDVNINGRTVDAAQALADIVQAINQGQGTVTVNGQNVPAQDALRSVIDQINSGAGTVTVNGQTVPAGQALAALLGRVNGSSATTSVYANTGPADAAARNFIARWNGRQVYINFGGSRITGATGGAVIGGGIIPGFAPGGPVRGPGTGTSDSVPAMLSNGEYVANAKQVRNAGGQAAFGRLMAGLAAGGPASSPTRASASSPGGGGVAVTFAGNTSDALATVIMQLVRTGKIQLKAA